MTAEEILLSISCINPPLDEEGLVSKTKHLAQQVSALIPAFLRDRKVFSEWQSKLLSEVAQTAPPRVKNFLAKLDGMTLGKLILFSRDELLKFRGAGKATVDDCVRWLMSIKPDVAWIAVCSFHWQGGRSTQAPYSSIAELLWQPEK